MDYINNHKDFYFYSVNYNYVNYILLDVLMSRNEYIGCLLDLGKVDRLKNESTNLVE